MTRASQKPQDAAKERRPPTHTLYHIAERSDDKAFWTEVGVVGWINTDGSVNLRTSAGAVLLPDHDYQLRARGDKGKNGASSA